MYVLCMIRVFSIVQGNLRSWLLDENCFDQSAVIYNQGSQVAIGECTPQEIRIVTEREVSCPRVCVCVSVYVHIIPVYSV